MTIEAHILILQTISPYHPLLYSKFHLVLIVINFYE